MGGRGPETARQSAGKRVTKGAFRVPFPFAYTTEGMEKARMEMRRDCLPYRLECKRPLGGRFSAHIDICGYKRTEPGDGRKGEVA